MTAIAAAWPTVKFGAVADFKNGLNFAAGAVGRGIKIVGVGDFGTRSELNDFSGLGQVEAPELDRSYLLKADDILFVRSNGNPHVCVRYRSDKSQSWEPSYPSRYPSTARTSAIR